MNHPNPWFCSVLYILVVLGFCQFLWLICCFLDFLWHKHLQTPEGRKQITRIIDPLGGMLQDLPNQRANWIRRRWWSSARAYLSRSEHMDSMSGRIWLAWVYDQVQAQTDPNFWLERENRGSLHILNEITGVTPNSNFTEAPKMGVYNRPFKSR